MNTRNEILTRLRAKTRETDLPAPWQSRRHFADLAERFSESLTAVHGEVLRAASREEALQQVGNVIAELGAQKVVVNGVRPLTDIPWREKWPQAEWYQVGQTEGDLTAFCAAADLGISSAAAALAETGSIVIYSGPAQSRLATLLPPVHLALVPTSCLTADLFTFTASRRGEMPANLVFVSGPSKTADIEQTMAIGVHGPKRFIVVLYM
ncbi:MAG TPA: lactate utilization protein [Chloroflexi bacterium]|nr:lactate utilization protein [Chloroflexota bacterium]